MATAGLADIHNSSWGRTEKKKRKTPIATGWQSSPDPTGNYTVVKDQLVVPALAPWLVQGSGRRESMATAAWRISIIIVGVVLRRRRGRLRLPLADNHLRIPLVIRLSWRINLWFRLWLLSWCSVPVGVNSLQRNKVRAYRQIKQRRSRQGNSLRMMFVKEQLIFKLSCPILNNKITLFLTIKSCATILL